MDDRSQPLQAIRSYCLLCKVQSTSAVQECDRVLCVLHPYRLGDQPHYVSVGPLETIEGYCLKCEDGSAQEVVACTAGDDSNLPCPLYTHRLGNSRGPPGLGSLVTTCSEKIAAQGETNLPIGNNKEFIMGRRPTKRGTAPFVQIHHAQIYSLAWRELNHPAVRAYLHLKAKYNGRNPEDLSLTYKEMEPYMSRRTFRAAMLQLVKYGFVKIVEHGGLPRRPNIYGLSSGWQGYRPA